MTNSNKSLIFIAVAMMMLLCGGAKMYAQLQDGTGNSFSAKLGSGATFTELSALTPTAYATEWDLWSGTKQIQVTAAFSQTGQAKTRQVEFDIPNGYTLVAATAKKNQTLHSSVTSIDVSDETDALINSVTLTAYDGTTFPKMLTGYTYTATNNSEITYPLRSAKLIYDFTAQCQNIVVTITLQPMQQVLTFAATTCNVPQLDVLYTSGSLTYSSHLNTTVTELVAHYVRTPNSSLAGQGYPRNVEGVVDAVNPDLGTVPEFNVGFGQWMYSSSAVEDHFVEQAVYTITYPDGATYTGFATTGAGVVCAGSSAYSSIWIDDRNNSSGGTFANGHLTISNNTATRTVTITYNHVFLRHTMGGAMFQTYWTATVNNSTVKWDRNMPFVCNAQITAGAIIGNTAVKTSAVTSNIVPKKPQVELSITPQNLTIRDLNANNDYPYSYFLGAFKIKNIGPSEPTNLVWNWNFSHNLQIRGVSFCTDYTDASQRNVSVTAITNKGTRTFNGVAPNNMGGTTNAAYIRSELLGMDDDEYFLHLEIMQPHLTVNDYSSVSYIYGGAHYFGKFKNGQSGDVTLSLTNADCSVVYATATDHTTVGWNNVGVGNTVFYTSKTAYQSTAETLFYPGDAMYVMTYTTTGTAYSNGVTNLDRVDPDIYITLPKGINLDVSSVEFQSPAGNHFDYNYYPLTPVSQNTFTDAAGIQQTVYKFSTPNRQDIIINAYNTTGSVTTGWFKCNYAYVRFTAYVSSACDAYPAISPQDLVYWDFGQTAVETNISNTMTNDKNNVTGKGTLYRVSVAASTSPNLSVVQKPGLTVSLGIKIKNASGDYYTYNGTAQSVAGVTKDLPAQVWLKYQNTSTDEYLVGSEIYLPIPKYNIQYDHYFHNTNIGSPASVEDAGTANSNSECSFYLDQPVVLPGFDTWYGISTSPATNYSSGAISTTWTPITMTWYDYASLLSLYAGNATDALNAVTMLKFVANQNITAAGTTGSEGETVFEIDVYDGAQLNQYDYWRSYQKGWRATDGTGTWVYGSVLAATPSMSGVRGKVFLDLNNNGAMDTGEEYTALGNMRATLTGTGISILNIAINADGSFQSLDGTDNYYLKTGSYTLTIYNDDLAVRRFNKHTGAVRSEHTGAAFPDGTDTWRMDIPQSGISFDNSRAVFSFTVTPADIEYQLVGVGMRNAPRFLKVNGNVRGYVE